MPTGGRPVNNYILDEDNNPVICPDINTWAAWFETADRHVAYSSVGDVNISTVFLGMGHNFGREGPPILWETMIFGGLNDGYQARCASYEDAKKEHEFAVKLVIITEKRHRRKRKKRK